MVKSLYAEKWTRTFSVDFDNHLLAHTIRLTTLPYMSSLLMPSSEVFMNNSVFSPA